LNPRPRFSFRAHPEALEDLLRAPAAIRDSALLHMQQLVRVQQRGPALGIRGAWDLRGCRKLYLDSEAAWRAVYMERDAAPGGTHPREIYLLAVGPRQDHAAYNDAAHRLGRTPGPHNDHGHAQRARAAAAQSPTAAAAARAQGITNPRVAYCPPRRTR